MDSKRVIAFCRVSTEEQASEDRAGIPRQLASIARTALNRNLEIVEEIILTDVSGSNVRNSPVFLEMLRKVRAKEIDGVVVSDLDRLIRPDNMADLDVIDQFRKAGVPIHTEGTTHNFESAEGTLLTHFTALFAGYERHIIKRRYQGAKEAKRKQGKCPSAKITLPTGVDYDFKSGTWIYTQEINKVTEAFRLVDEEGRTNLREIAGIVGLQDRTVWNILRNPIYSGWRVYDKKRGEEKYDMADGKQADRKKIPRNPDQVIRVKVFDPPAVPEDRFQRVQDFLNQKGAKWRRQRETVETNLGTGLARCAHCGRRLYASSGRRSTGSRHGYYYCAANDYLAKRKGLSCQQPSVQKKHLDKTLVSFVGKFLADGNIVANLAKTVSTPAEDHTGGAKDRIADLEKRRARLLLLYEGGSMEIDALNPRLTEIKNLIENEQHLIHNHAERVRIKGEAARSLRLLVKACVAFKAISNKQEQQIALRTLFASVAFEGQKIVGFVPSLPGMKLGCTDNGSRICRDSSRR